MLCRGNAGEEAARYIWRQRRKERRGILMKLPLPFLFPLPVLIWAIR